MRVTTSSFETTDLDQACHLMALAYADNHLRISSNAVEGLRLAVTRHDLGPVRADSYDSTLTLGYQMEHPNFVTLSQVTSGTVDFDDGHEAFVAGPGDLMATVPGQEYGATVHGSGVRALSVDLDLLSEVSGEDPDTLRSRLHNHQIDPVAARGWSLTASYTLAGALAAPTDRATDSFSALWLSSANRIFAAAMLATVLPETPPVASDRIDARPASLRRAIAFIESNPHLPIVTADIARAASVSVTTLRLAFRRYLDTTPTTYLRTARLEHVHSDLDRADPDDTVPAIARRWGFSDLHQFTQLYQETYHQHPDRALGR